MGPLKIVEVIFILGTYHSPMCRVARDATGKHKTSVIFRQHLAKYNEPTIANNQTRNNVWWVDSFL